MGFEVEDYPFKVKTGVFGLTSSLKQFSDLFSSILESGCDVFMAPLFTDK